MDIITPNQVIHFIEKDDDYGQFCDLEEHIKPEKTRLPSMESIPETMENSPSNQSFHDEPEHCGEIYRTTHPIIDGVKNILNVNQYIYNMVWATPEKQKQLLYHVICSTIVGGVVVIVTCMPNIM